MFFARKLLMGYGVIILLAAIVLPIRYHRIEGASLRSKRIVFSLALASFVIPWCIPKLAAVTMWLQLAICFYVLTYLHVIEEPVWPTMGPRRKPESETKDPLPR